MTIKAKETALEALAASVAEMKQKAPEAAHDMIDEGSENVKAKWEERFGNRADSAMAWKVNMSEDAKTARSTAASDLQQAVAALYRANK